MKLFEIAALEIDTEWYKIKKRIKIILNNLNCITYFMTLEEKNQNDIIYNELINSYEIEYIFNNEPINRFTKPNKSSNKSELLNSLKEKILNIENCNLK